MPDSTIAALVDATLAGCLVKRLENAARLMEHPEFPAAQKGRNLPPTPKNNQPSRE